MTTDVDETVEAFRSAFDRAFALPEATADAPLSRFLGIAIGDVRYAIPIGEVAALSVARKVVPLPAARGGLLGICGYRSTVVPVFDLGALLGQGVSPACRWLILHGGREMTGLAFPHLDGQIEGRPVLMSRKPSGDTPARNETILEGPPARTVISLSAVAELIAKMEK